MTAFHWRTMRLKLVQSGVSNPMGLSTMHIVLDATEAAILESISMSGERDAEFQRSQFLDQLYSPANDVGLGDGRAVPAGFEPDEVDSAFDAFAAATSGATP